MRRALLVLVTVVVLAGCVGAPVASDGPEPGDSTLGVVDGVAYDDDLAITVEDGLNQTELETLATRSMARIEVIRDLEFEETVDIQVMTREEYRENYVTSNVSENRTRWQNQVWEAKFVVGQDRDVTDVFDRTFGDAVQGFYSPANEEVVIVTDEDRTKVNKQTLVHELVHVLQDQQFGLDSSPARQDPALARNGLIEGEAELIPELYFERCEREWSCLEPPAPPIDTDRDVDPGVILVFIQPYEQGPGFVEAMREQGGWDQVNELHDAHPESTTQIIHPERYPDVRPVNVTVEDHSSEAWSRIDHDPVGETVGQAAIHVMLQYNEIITVEEFFGYSHPTSDGWAGDELVPYVNDDDETGHVWESEWESTDDAAEFTDAFVTLLEEHGALERGQESYLVPDGPFEGGFDVRLDDTTVTIVNGPSVESLGEIHSG